MGIEDIFIKEIALGENFDYKALYNDSTRGGVYKTDYRALLDYCIENKIIKVKKYLIAENINESLWNIIDTRGKREYLLMERIREYPSENDWFIAPLVYILKKVDSNIKINKDNPLLIDANIDVKLRHRVGLNATARIYLPNEKICFNSENDNIDNLMDTIEVDNISLYIIGTEDKNFREKDIIAYEIIKAENFNGLKNKVEHSNLDAFLNQTYNF